MLLLPAVQKSTFNSDARLTLGHSGTLGCAQLLPTSKHTRAPTNHDWVRHEHPQRYDFLSTGMGALCVTGWCWAHGQPPLEALSITGVATVAGLVINELCFQPPPAGGQGSGGGGAGDS
jgi:hypothetical protein